MYPCANYKQIGSIDNYQRLNIYNRLIHFKSEPVYTSRFTARFMYLQQFRSISIFDNYIVLAVWIINVYFYVINYCALCIFALNILSCHLFKEIVILSFQNLKKQNSNNK